MAKDILSSYSRDDKYCCELLASLFPFSLLSTPDVASLYSIAELIRYKSGDVIVNEDDIVDSFFVLVEGKVEVLQKKILDGKINNILLMVLENAGQTIGLTNQGYFSTTGKRTATVVAMTEVRLLRFGIANFNTFIRDHPAFNTQFKNATELLAKIDFIRQMSLFITLSNDEIYKLAQQIEDIILPAKAILFKQGDPGDSCCIIISGQVEVFITEKNIETHLAILEKSNLIGESALLTHSPRNASIRTLTVCRFYVLKRDLLFKTLSNSKTFAQSMLSFMVSRIRPSPNKGVIARIVNIEGNVKVMLQNPKNQRYYPLTEESWFIWQQLDGIQTIQDIAIAFFRQYKALVPEMICNLLYNLAESGFVEVPAINDVILVPEAQQTWLQKKISQLLKKFHFEFDIIHTDNWLTWLYNHGIYIFYSDIAKIFLFVFALLGVFSFISMYFPIIHSAQKLQPHFWIFLILMIPVSILTVVLHELGHACTAKNLGYKVERMGVGWLLGAPFAYVDTSELWIADRRSRLLVTISGIYVDCLVAGSLALLSTLIGIVQSSIYLWLFSLMIYYNAFKNLNPIREYDGYSLLSDGLQAAHLRKISLQWAADKSRALKGHKNELIYWLCAILYILLSMIILFNILQTLFAVFRLPAILGIQTIFISLGIVAIMFIIVVRSFIQALNQFIK